MKNETIAWIVVAVVVVGTSIWLIVGGLSSTPGSVSTTTPSGTSTGSQTTSNTPGTGTTNPGGKEANPQTSGVGSLTFLLSQKANWKCSVTTRGTGVKRSGTLYVANTRARGNFTGVVGGQTTMTSMIDNGLNLYLWTNGNTKGLKLSATLSASGSAAATNGGVDPAAQLDYDCYPWTADMAQFTLPAGVTF